MSKILDVAVEAFRKQTKQRAAGVKMARKNAPASASAPISKQKKKRTL